jgi:uncharacterized protein (DUF58 family)
MIPTRAFAALIALSAPVWLIFDGVAPAALLSGSLVLLAIIDALATPGSKQLRLRRDLPASIGLADSADAEYHIESAWPLRLTVDVHDALATGIELRAKAHHPVMPWHIGRVLLPARARATLTVGLIGCERGEHTLGPVVLRVGGPLGLVQRTVRYHPAGIIAVVPSIADVRHYRLLALQHRLREVGVRTLRRRGQGTSFANLREYVMGDDPRHIDWKASARRAKLITREFAVEQGQAVVIAIDAGRMMTQLVGTMSRFECALASATVLADVAIRSGDHVALLVFNDEVRAFVPPARGALALQRIRAAMLPLQARMVEPDYAGAFRTLAARHRKRSLIVLFTDVVDPRASRAVIAHTVRSTVRHLPLVVAMQNDELMAAAAPRAGNDQDFFESAAAEELLLERHEALARMRQAGVSVLDVSPRVMTAAVVNRYLAIKARAAL